ncbi:DUF2510 domain-containing protein [Microbacterium sp. NPDC057407]|uniref:DUF2510 domain-containing protein n=1 Tax=Microbacterium sp. NPDC057407 TaxID=3346120 RepID=UPI003671EFB9
MTAPSTPSMPAGWYSAGVADELRYWDGSEWTEHTRPANQSAEPTASAPTADAAGKAAGSTRAAKGVPPWWVWAVIGLAVLVVTAIVIASLSAARPQAGSQAGTGVAQGDSRRPFTADEPDERGAAAPEPLEVGETAFGMDAERGTGWYAVEITNPNDDYVFTALTDIGVDAYDSAGVLIDTDTLFANVSPGTSIFVGYC